MDKRRSNKIVKFLTERLLEDGIKIDKVILFGSYYSGKPHKDSDIDIAVISNDFEDKDVFELGPMTGNAVRATIRKFDIPVDLIKLTLDEYENETRMIASYVKEGKVVYSK